MKIQKNNSPQPRRLIILLGVMILLGVLLMGSVSAAKVIHVEDKEDVNEILKDNFNDKYGVERVTDTILWIIPDKRAEYSLTSNTEQCLTECEAYGEAVLYKNTKLFDNINFKDKQKTSKTVPYQMYIKDNRTFNVTDYILFDTICNSTFENETEKDCYNTYNETQREVQEEYWKPYNSETLPEGNYEWKIVGKKGINEDIDFIPISNELELSAWAWWNSSWDYNRQIIINSTVGSTLTDFTPWIRMDTAALISAGKMNSNCSDLRLLDNNNITELDYEIQEGTCNKTNTIIWTRIPSLTSGNYTIYAYYGNPAAGDNQDLAGVWQNYTFVLHHSGWKLSKPEGYLTWNSSVTNTTDTWLTGDNSTFHNPGGSASSTMLVVPHPGSFTHDFNKGFYVYWRISNRNNGWDSTAYPLTFSDGTNSIAINWCGGDSGSNCDTDTDEYAYARSTLGGGTTTKISNSFGYNTWHFLGFTGNTNDNAAWTYFDGAFNTRNAITYTTGSVTLYADGSAGSGIGQVGAGNQGAWNGTIGETRLGEFNATADWIKADYSTISWVSATEEQQPSAAENLTTCKNSSWTTGITYTLQNDISAAGDCFVLNETNNVILNFNGFNITGNGTGYGINITGINNVTIKNGKIYGFDRGITTYNMNLSVINNMTLNSNNVYGIFIGGDGNPDDYFSNFTNLIVNSNTYQGIYVSNPDYNYFENISLANNYPSGFFGTGEGSMALVSSQYNILNNITISSSPVGIYLSNSYVNTIKNSFISGTGYEVYSSSSGSMFFTNSTFIGTSYFYNGGGGEFKNVTGGTLRFRDSPSWTINNSNFSSITQINGWANSNDVRIYKSNGNGEIYFSQLVNDVAGNIDTEIALSENYAYLNNASLTGLDIPANITFHNLPAGTKYIARDGQPCVGCIAFTSLNAPTVLFQVPGWSNYTLENDTTAPYFVTIPANASLWYGNESLSVQFDANDTLSSFVNYSLNDTRFAMTVFLNGTGILKNATSLPADNYAINVTINDSININWTIYLVEVKKLTGDCDVLINTTSPVEYPNTFLVWSNCNSAFTLRRNNTIISNNTEQVLGVSAYNFSVQRTGGSNYTNYYDDLEVRVVDTVYPIVTINSPLNISYYTNTILFNFTITELLPDKTIYGFNATNYTYTTPINRTLANGRYDLTVWSNDTSGQLTIATRSFTVDQLLVILNSPTNNSAVEENVSFNATVIDYFNPITNVSLYLNGTLNETSTTGVNGTYTFWKKLNPSVLWNWLIQAFSSNQGNSSSGTFGIPLYVDLVSPANNYAGTNYVNFTCSAQELNTTISHMQKGYYITNLSLWTNSSGTWNRDDYYAITRNSNNSFNGTYDRYTNPGDTWGTTTYTWDYNDETADTVHWVDSSSVQGTQGLFFASPNQVIDWVYVNVTSWESRTAGIYPTPTGAQIQIHDGNTWINVPGASFSWASYLTATYHWKFWGNLGITNASGIRVFMGSTSGDGNNDPTYQVYSLEYGRNNLTTMPSESTDKDDYFKQNYTKSFYKYLGSSATKVLWNCETSNSDNLKTTSRSVMDYVNRSVDTQLIIGDINYTSSIYETQTTSYWINVSANASLTGVKLYLGGTPYTAVQSGDIWNYTFGAVPSSKVGYTPVIFGLTYSGVEYNTSTQYQTISPIQLGLCNATLTVPYINFTFKDESNLSSISATIPSSSFNYWLGDGTAIKTLLYNNATANPSYAFCFSPGTHNLNMNYSIQYAGSIYPQRTYTVPTVTYTNITPINVVLYLLGSGSGQYVTFITATTLNTPISNVEITITRVINGNTVTVSNGFSDAAGSFTAWLNPNYPHTITAIKTGYTTNIQTISPTQAVYTLVMGGQEQAYKYVSTIEGIKWYAFPIVGRVKTNSSIFGFNASAQYNNLTRCRIELLNNNKSVVLASANATASADGSNCYVEVNYTRDNIYPQVKGRLMVDLGDGWAILEEDAYWIFMTIDSTGLTFTDWLDGLTKLELSYFNNDEQHREYTYILIFFLVVMIICASLNLFGWDVQTSGGMIFLVGVLVIIGSIPGLLNLAYISPFGWVDKYFVAMIYTLFMIGFAAREMI